MFRKIPLLMTATIAPRNCPDAEFSDGERREQYLKAFSFYLGLLANSTTCKYDGIIFAENSAADISDFKKMVPCHLSNCVEFIKAPSELFPVELRKNNEFLLIDYVVDHSVLVREALCFFKVTGRYWFRNINSLVGEIRTVGESLDLYCDQRDHNVYSSLGLKKKEKDGETRYFYCSRLFWCQNFYGYFRKNPQWRRVEDVMFDVARQHYGDNRCRFRFVTEPFQCGNRRSGSVVSFGIHWSPSVFSKIYLFRWCLDSLLRRWFPRFWF